VEIIFLSYVKSKRIREPGREFGLAAIATRNCLLHGTCTTALRLWTATSIIIIIIIINMPFLEVIYIFANNLDEILANFCANLVT
jgi:hypothetical protein